MSSEPLTDLQAPLLLSDLRYLIGTAQPVKQSSKILLLLLPKLKWHPDQQISTVFANANGVKQSSTFVIIIIAGSPRIILDCRVGFAFS